MLFDIYIGTKKTEDGQHFALVVVDEPSLSYTFIRSVGYEPIDALHAEIIALEAGTKLATRLIPSGHMVNIFHSLDDVILDNGNILEGNPDDDVERFYCMMESMVLENILFIDSANTDMVLVKIEPEKNLSIMAVEDNDLGYLVDIDDLQIVDRVLAEDYLSSIS